MEFPKGIVTDLTEMIMWQAKQNIERKPGAEPLTVSQYKSIYSAVHFILTGHMERDGRDG